MIYHCKFGKFGIVEGQCTEPSGVAVTEDNEIIVADTNNDRIQFSMKRVILNSTSGKSGKEMEGFSTRTWSLWLLPQGISL